MPGRFIHFDIECDRLIESRVDALRRKSFSDLIEMQAFSDNDVRILGVTASLLTSIKEEVPGEVKVIVEVFWKTFLIFTKSRRKGFAMNSTGDTRELMPQEYW